MKCISLPGLLLFAATLHAQIPEKLGPGDALFPHILIKSISIRQMPLKDGLDEIKRKASEASGGKFELNFVFPHSVSTRLVSLELSDVPLPQVIKYFADVAGLDARTDRSAIVFTPKPGLGGNVSKAIRKPADNGGPAEAPKANKPAKQRIAYSSIPQATVYQYISKITLGWQSHVKTKKAESQRQVLFREGTGRFADEFFKAVEEINHAFGYQKLIPQLSTKKDAKEQAIVVYLGSKKDGRKFLLESARQGNGSSKAWDGWFWWDDTKEMSQAAIAIYKEEVNEHSLRYYLRRSILTALGFPGQTERMGSIFDHYLERYPSHRDATKDDAVSNPFISDVDIAILRFCDRLLSTDASRSDIRSVISKHWLQFASDMDKAVDAAAIQK